MRFRPSLLVALALALASCGAVGVPLPSASEAPILPEGDPITAKTAVLVLTASEEGKAPEGDVWRISTVASSAGAKRGFSGVWDIELVSINENLLARFRVTTPNRIAKLGEEPLNPVFDAQGPPFLLEEWDVDSSDAARSLPEGSVTESFFLETNDGGLLQWSVTLEDASRVFVVAGQASIETPAPPDEKIRFPRR